MVTTTSPDPAVGCLLILAGVDVRTICAGLSDFIFSLIAIVPPHSEFSLGRGCLWPQLRETSSERLRGISSFDNGKTKVFSAVCCQGTNKAK